MVCGIAGTELEPGERALLQRLRPGGVILFARNVASREQLSELIAALSELPSRPHVAIDLEGGRVNRLRALLGELPAPANAAVHGSAALAALGAALGAACAHLGIGVDYAPVVDLACAGGYVGGEGRCLGATAEEAASAARTLLEALEGFGVAGCLKHFPGLGSGAVDSHRELPLLGDEVAAEREAFFALCAPARAVMVAHALAPSLGDALRPASLSDVVIAPLRARACGPIIGDDLEMGALGAYGSIPERAAAALLAGCDQVLVCNALAEREPVVAHVEAWRERDHGLGVALSRATRRAAGFGLGTLRPVTWDEVIERVERAWEAAGGRP